MTQIAQEIPQIEEAAVGQLPLEELLAGARPRVLRGIARHWGITRAGLESDAAAMDYLRGFYNGKVIGYSLGPPSIHGRLFYEGDHTKLNFTNYRGELDSVLRTIADHAADPSPPTLYVGSTMIDSYFPGFRRDNDVDFASHGIDPPPSIWIGNRTIASCHYDAPNNIACSVVGRRRFTLFPPDQIFNLYPGPLDPTPGGQAISLVDFENPDFDRFPRFREALASAMAAELEPGDAIFVPSMWWHHVVGLSAFNVLINYWWGSCPKHIPTPMNALYHAIWSLRDRPENEKKAWRDVFEYYVFGDRERAMDHIPAPARGILAPIDDDQARLLRAMLINKLNR